MVSARRVENILRNVLCRNQNANTSRADMLKKLADMQTTEEEDGSKIGRHPESCQNPSPHVNRPQTINHGHGTISVRKYTVLISGPTVLSGENLTTNDGMGM